MSIAPSNVKSRRATRHLAMFLPVLNGGGAERMMRYIGSELSRRDVQCDLLVATDKGPPLNTLPEGVNIVRLHKKNCRRAIPALAHYIRTARPDVVLSTVFSANIAAIVAARHLRNRPRLVIREASRTDSQISLQRGVQRHIDQLLKKLMYPKADFVIAVSRDVQLELINSKLTSPSSSRVIYNPLTRPGIARRKPPAGDTAPPTILACGRLEPEKDYPTLLRALKIVLGARDVKLTILGGGSLLADLQQLASSLDIHEHVTFEGFVEDTGPFLMRASVFVHTSRYEGFPSAILEAITAECPVVATDSPGGARELLHGGEYGALVPVGDANAVAASIIDILDGEVSFRVPADYAEQFSIANVATEYFDVLFPEPMAPVPARGNR